jgi:hypothetical protein
MNTPARIRRQPVPELVDLVRALAYGQAEADHAAQRLANRTGSARKASA